MATPSSRHNPAATPAHLTSSPHPSAVAMGRGLSHKSTSIKTPSASALGAIPGHNTGTASHQSATPLTATAGLDDPVSLSSPSALLALGGFTGMSPALNGADGLVNSAMNDGDLRALTLGLGGPRNHEEERRKHIEEVVQLLRGGVSGRGVSREAVERLGRLQGFESIWQDDSLSIAGNLVDLEIEFYPGEDNVKDVSLSYASLQGETESGRREEATAVLKSDLIQTLQEREQRVWKSLKGFQSNLERLAKLDHLSQEVNCFEAIESLFESLQKVWDAENQREIYESTYDHICRGTVGRPSLHKRGRVGMGLEYWVETHRILRARQKKRLANNANGLEAESSEEKGLRSVTVECEEGFPSLRISKEWVGSEVLTTVESNDVSTGSESVLVNWTEPPPTLPSNLSELGTGMMGSDTTNRRFIAKLEPHIHVPLLVANDIYRHVGLNLPPDYRTTMYDELLVPGWTSNGKDSNGSVVVDSVDIPEKRRRKTVLSFNEKDEPLQNTHCYSFQAFEATPGMTIREFPFSHPRQLADIFPIFRQYSLLSTLMQKLFPRNEMKSGGTISASRVSSNASDRVSTTGLPGFSNESIRVLNNRDPHAEYLNSLLKTGTTSSEGQSGNANEAWENDIRVDVTLRTQVGQAPLIMLSITLPVSQQKASVGFEIRLNGRVEIVQLSGLGEDKTQSAPLDSKQIRRLKRVLEISEDISVLVEYVVVELRGPP